MNGLTLGLIIQISESERNHLLLNYLYSFRLMLNEISRLVFSFIILSRRKREISVLILLMKITYEKKATKYALLIQ